MSRPIYEPTPARMDSQLTYGSDQLFRRPAPMFAGTTVFPTFRARKQVATQNIISGPQNITVCWDCWEICDEDVFSVITTGGPGECEDFLLEVGLNRTGVYAIHAQLHYQDSLTFKAAIGMFDDVNDRMWYDLDDWLDVGTAAPSLSFQVVRLYNEFDAAQIRIETMHTSATDEVLGSYDTGDSCVWQMVYLGDYDCEDCPGSATEIYIGGGGTCDNC